MIQAKQELLHALGVALAQVAPEAALPPVFESPKHASHGDLAIPAAMALAKPLLKSGYGAYLERVAHGETAA